MRTRHPHPSFFGSTMRVEVERVPSTPVSSTRTKDINACVSAFSWLGGLSETRGIVTRKPGSGAPYVRPGRVSLSPFCLSAFGLSVPPCTDWGRTGGALNPTFPTNTDRARQPQVIAPTAACQHDQEVRHPLCSHHLADPDPDRRVDLSGSQCDTELDAARAARHSVLPLSPEAGGDAGRAGRPEEGRGCDRVRRTFAGATVGPRSVRDVRPLPRVPRRPGSERQRKPLRHEGRLGWLLVGCRGAQGNAGSLGVPALSAVRRSAVAAVRRLLTPHDGLTVCRYWGGAVMARFVVVRTEGFLINPSVAA